MAGWSHDPLVRHLVQMLGPCRTSGEEVMFCSPFQSHFKNPNHEDVEFKLYVNPIKGKFICHKSGICGSISYLFAVLGSHMEEHPTAVLPLDELKLKAQSIDLSQQFVRPNAELPDWYKPIEKGSAAFNYLIGRGLTEEDINFYKLGEGTGEFNDRVVLPSFDANGQCEYWVTRYIKPRPDGLRYDNPRDVPRRFHLGFLHVALAHSPRSVILCEGVFSALVAGREAVAAYGKQVTDYQINRLAECGVTHVNLALDGDARQTAVRTAYKIIMKGLSCTLVVLPDDEDHKDPAALGRAGFRRLLEASQPLDMAGVLRLRLELVGRRLRAPTPAPTSPLDWLREKLRRV